MKKYLSLIVIIALPLLCPAQTESQNMNLISTEAIWIEETNAANIPNLVAGQKSTSVTYFDGLGRPMQTVIVQGSPLGYDIVQPIVYDEYGREARKYLPTVVSEKNGWYKPNIIGENGDYAGLAATNMYNNGEADKVRDDPQPYALTRFEPSPLNRIAQQGMPGEAWQPEPSSTYASPVAWDFSIKKSYESNEENEVLLWRYTAPSDSYPLGLVNTGTESAPEYYGQNQLKRYRTKDEHQNEVIEYIDKGGRIVLKRVQALPGSFSPTGTGKDTNYASTYYIYDDLGNLVCVIPPEATRRLAAEYYHAGSTVATKDDFLSRWAFRYTYDRRQRMTQKQVPSAAAVYMVYDNRDRLVMTQDGNQRNPPSGTAKSWTFIKYDALDRPVLTGRYEHGATSQTAMQTALDTFYDSATSNEYFEERGSAVHGYTNRSYPSVGNVNAYNTVTYYDNYSFKNLIGHIDYDYKNGELAGQESNENIFVKGMVTGTKTRVLGSTEFLWNINYYDKKYRLVQQVTENYPEGYDRVSNVYNFPGWLMETKVGHHKGGGTVTVHKEYEYDHAGRLEKIYHQIGSNDRVLLAKNEYNELGELVKKNLHKEGDGTFAQSVDYRYNIRGWLTRINNSDLSPDAGDTKEDLFGMGLFYNFGFDKPQYNGNISGVRWKNKVDEVERAYGYTYDPMNRLTGADYIAGGTGNWTQEADRFEVGNLSYDLNGNIKTLHRNGLFRQEPLTASEYGITDQLDYKYKGNQLMAVNDAITTPGATRNEFKDNGSKGNLNSPEYEYDDNGNMTHDGNKGIDIVYNRLNLPKRVDFGEEKYIEYTYDATGIKLKQTVHDGTEQVKETVYSGNMVYENGQLQFIQHEEGRAMMVDSEGQDILPEYQYHLKDHLGNVRLTFTSKPERYESNASIEPDLADGERADFINYDKVTKINSDLFNHTAGTDSHYSIRLSGTEGEKIGLAKSLAVMTGDTIRATVFGKYLDPEQTNYDQLVQNIVATVVTAGATGTGTEAGTSTGGEGAFPFGGLLNKTEGDQGVMAYLNYLVFDKEGVLNEGQSGYVALSTGAREDGTGKPHEKLSKEIVVTEPGFVYIYLSNDSPEPLEVIFDDFEVEQVHSAIVQADDYYPFGLTFNSYKRENSLGNRYLYNGKELQDELGLGLYDYGARFYDPAIGRWHAVDPLAHEYYSWAPYNYTLNNPVLYVDPNGEFVGTLIGGVVGGIAGGIKAAVKGENILAGIGEGATAGVIAGAIVDITVASGGTGLVLIGAAATGGGLGAIAGDMVGQGIVGFTEKGQSISEAASLDNKDFSKTMDKALKGMAAGAVGGVAGVAVGKAMESARASTKVILESMSKNIDETATTLRTMGASTSTTQQAVNKITEGMGAVGRNTANNVVKTESAVSGTVEVVNQTLGGGSVNEKKITYPTGILGQE